MFPIEVTVSDDELDPVVSGPFAVPPAVSLAHAGPVAAAVVGRADSCGPPGIGIDIESVRTWDMRTETAILTETERDMLDALCGVPAEPDPLRAKWLTRFWAAKEAAAKAEGTGLGGQPDRFVVTAVDGDRLLVAVHDDAASRTHRVATRLGDEPTPYAVAWIEGGETDDS